MKEFSAISQFVSSTIAGIDNPSADPATQKELERRWMKCAGRAAPHSFPQLFINGRLVVFTESPIWATELRYDSNSLLKALADLGVTVIEFKNIPKIFTPPQPAKRKIVLSGENCQVLDKTASRLKHDGLRVALKRLAQKRSSIDSKS